MKIKYSFVIPVYGCEQYLEECVDSILAQKSDHSFEVILVDDGSRDRSGQIADMLASRDNRIRTFHKENGGAASARNFGLQKVTGDYVLFVDSDDTVEDQLLNHVDEALAENPEALVIFGITFDFYWKKTCIRSQVLSCKHSGIFFTNQVLENCRDFFYDNALSSVWNKVFLTDTIRKFGLEMKAGMTLYEDLDFVLRYLACVEKVYCIPRSFYHYRNDLEAIHLDSRVASLEKVRENMCALIQSAQTLSTESVSLKEICADLYLLLLWQHLKGSHYTVEALKEHVIRYCEEPGFRELLAPDVSLGSFEKELFSWIENGEFQKLHDRIRKNRIMTKVKRTVKKILRTVGIKK